MLAIVLSFLSVLAASQYLMNPRGAPKSPFLEVTQSLARGIFGENCALRYRVTDKRQAVELAKERWRWEAEYKPSKEIFRNAFDSEAFRNGWINNSYRNGTGWSVILTGEGSTSQWEIGFGYRDDPGIDINMSLILSRCGWVSQADVFADAYEAAKRKSNQPR